MRILVASILIFLTYFTYAQELTLPINTLNLSVSLKGTNGGDTLSLPFFEDFSDTQVSTSSERWSDSDVYINSEYTDRMPSVGIATFDAVNSSGQFYEQAMYETSYIADKLTSKPIYADAASNSNVWMSFYYRPQGFGDAPEAEDSLILQFYAPELQTWHTVWSAEGTYDKEFQQVMLPIADDKFLKDGFRFRFLNYASLGSSMYADLAGNCDFWHIDYIYLNTNRTESNTSYNDISFSKPMTSILKDYVAVPWKHYLNVPAERKASFKIAIQNHHNSNRSIDSLNFYNTHIESNSKSLLESGARNINAFGYLEPAGLMNLLEFQSNTDDTATFEISAELVTDDSDFGSNNRISFLQNFHRYYAYDDGTAEAAYGLYGTGTKYGMAAYRFEALKPDSLEGVYMYFSRTLNDVSQKYFWLNFWYPNDNGLPQDTVFEQIEGALPNYTEQRNEFVYYKFPKPIYVEKTFFIGWTQTTDNMLNVGFDWNTKANQHLFFNISGSWTPSQIEGAVMMRPQFMQADIQNQTKESISENISISPNPAVDFIRITTTELPEGSLIRIYNIQGQLVKQFPLSSSNDYYINDLSKGIYYLQANDGQKLFRSKFIKQ